MKRISFLLLPCIMILSSCSEQELSEGFDEEPSQKLVLSNEEYTCVFEDNECQELSLEEAKEVATSFIENIYGTTRAGHNDMKLLKQDYIITKDSVTPDSILLYHVKINNGIAVVSADRRKPVVIAFIENIDNTDSLDTEMMYLAENSLVGDIATNDSLRKELVEPTLRKISKFVNRNLQSVEDVRPYKKQIKVEDGKDVSVTRSPGYSTWQTDAIARVGNFGKTEWDQESPYNCKLPIDYNNPNAVLNYPAGCAVIAIAQAFACTNVRPDMTVSNTVIDWDYLTETSKIKSLLNGGEQAKMDMVGYLIKDIYDGTKSTPVYRTLSDGTKYVYEVQTTESNMYAYMTKYVNCDKIQQWSSEKVKTSLDNVGVVLALGKSTVNNGHVWVIDGWVICKKGDTARMLVKNYDVYYHAMMGWSVINGNNGYYLVNEDTSIDFETKSGGTYKSSNIKMFSNIRHKY